MRTLGRAAVGWALLAFAAACADSGGQGRSRTPAPNPSVEPVVEPGPDLPADVLTQLRALSPATLPGPRPDPTNAFADNPTAAALGHKLFFDPRFSGPLLDLDNTGLPGTLGAKGETGKVACVGCHISTTGFLDSRSNRRQISLAAGWSRRRTPSLLDFGQRSLLMWDGRRDASFNQVFGVIDNPLEFNSSRIFVAQQIARFYKAEYEALFGPMPSLDAFAAGEAQTAGCEALPKDPLVERCPKPGHDDPAVIGILVNMGKAIGAYMRTLTCGPSRFDEWMHGKLDALTEREQTGAVLFARSSCDKCHSGPFLTDDRFYNVGSANKGTNFIQPYDDPGAVMGVQALLADTLNSKGTFSDGYDGRLDELPEDPETLRGAFKTPSLRCVGMRPSYMHAGQLRSLEDAVLFFSKGGDSSGYQGQKDPSIVPLDLTSDDRDAIVAFLRALDGPGPALELTAAPALPE